MIAKKDLIGVSFSRWTVIAMSGNARTVMCVCACGMRKEVHTKMLRRGTSKSCGCLRDELLSARPRKGGGGGDCSWLRTHGESHRNITPEYSTWRAMRARCLNPKHRTYGYYGGRGITICDRWRESFEAFLVDMGRRPSRSHSIDRIDPNGNYEPGNCRWATAKEQRANQRPRIHRK